jgi:TonB family protein
MGPRIVRFAFAFVLLSGLSCISASNAQSQTDFDFDASRVASAIQKLWKASHGEPAKVLVMDFEDRHAPRNELEHELSVEFSASLERHATGFVVLKGDDLRQALLRNNLPKGALPNSALVQCYAPDLGIDFIVSATIELAPDGAVTDFDVQQSDFKSVFGQTSIVPLSDSVRALESKTVPQPPPVYTPGGETWVSPTHAPAGDDQVVTYEKAPRSYKGPECTYCPQATYSDKAVKAKAQGTVSLRVQILADGFPSKIFVVRGLPCGLTGRAMDAVKAWKFKPGSVDDHPVAVDVSFEVTFHLY